MPVIDTLIFDFDGVIIDTETPDFATWQEVFRSHGVEMERDWWTRFIGGSSRRMDISANWRSAISVSARSLRSSRAALPPLLRFPVSCMQSFP